MQTVKLGFFPMAMLYRSKGGEVNPQWKKFQRTWSRPALIYGQIKNTKKGVVNETKER